MERNILMSADKTWLARKRATSKTTRDTFCYEKGRKNTVQLMNIKNLAK